MPGYCYLLWRTWHLLELPKKLRPFLLLHKSELQCHHGTLLLMILVHSAFWRSIPTVGSCLQWSCLTLPPHRLLSAHTTSVFFCPLPFCRFFWGIPDCLISLFFAIPLSNTFCLALALPLFPPAASVSRRCCLCSALRLMPMKTQEILRCYGRTRECRE